VLSSGRSLPAYCLAVSIVELNPTAESPGIPAITLVGMTSGGKLVISSSQEAPQTPLAENATSFTVTPSYLVYITTAHEARFAPISALQAGSRPESRSELRRVERGSRIVVAVPSAMSLVLQMPRGNLETIFPRPFVLEVIRSNVKECV
jgi:elongator complex protein 1